MYRDGARVFVEVGPGSTLASLVRTSLHDADAAVLAVDHQDGWFGLLNALARLFVVGVPWSQERLIWSLGARGAGIAGGVTRRDVATDKPPLMKEIRTVVDGHRESAAAAVVERHQRLMKLFLESQTRVMVGYLRDSSTQAGLFESELGDPVSATPKERGLRSHETSGLLHGSGTDGVAPADGRDVLARLRSIVADLTGYPPEMLDPDLDLEADLGIDSIKRVEILVELQDQSLLPIDAAGDEAKAFTQLTTLSGMADRLRVAAQVSRPVDGTVLGESGTRSPEARMAGRDTSVLERKPTMAERMVAYGEPVESASPTRRVLTLRAIQPSSSQPSKLPTGNVAITAYDTELASVVAKALPRGLTPVVLDSDSHGVPCMPCPRESNPFVGYIHLGAMSSRPQSLNALRADADMMREDLFRFVTNLKRLEKRLRSSHGFVFATTRFGGFRGEVSNDFNPLAGGYAGVLKSISQEWSEVTCRAVEVAASVDENALVGFLVDELRSADDFTEVVYGEGGRHIVVPIPREPQLACDPVSPLSEGDVVLVTGGGRGITAEVALAVAKRWRPTLVLVGRTMPGSEESRYRPLNDEVALKREIAEALGESGDTPDLQAVQRKYAYIARARELNENLRRLRATGVDVWYVTADVGDPVSFKPVLAAVYQRYGRIDGVIHGAGVIEDCLVGDKDQESFERVLSPKVDGALTLVEDLRLDELRFLCFFSSTAALYGNAGQSDYAAANETLNRLARWLAPRVRARVLAMNWGPWEPGTGMVGDALAKRFKERGIPVVTRDQGTKAFIDELGFGARESVEVVFG